MPLLCRSCILQADSEKLRQAWIQAVQTSIASAYREKGEEAEVGPPPPLSPASIPLEALDSPLCSCSRLGLWPGTRRAEPLGAAGRGPWGLRRSSPSTFLLLLQVERKRPPSTGSPESSHESKEKSLKGEGSLQRVQAIAGNVVCCDCGQADPRWASINLGITLCIECSGIHRWASGQRPLGPPSHPASFLSQCLLSAL